MAFDGMVLAGIVHDFQIQLTGGRIEKIYQPESDEIIFFVHAGKATRKLYVSCNSSHARIHFLEETGTMPQTPMAFCMLLRKHLQGGRIRSIEQKDSERVFMMTIETVNEMGYSVTKRLIIEIMGKHSNIILLDGNSGKIIDSIKRISIDVSRARQVLPGLPYVFPPNQGKVSFFHLDEDGFDLIFHQDSNPAKSLVTGIMGISPSIANEIVDRAPNGSQTACYQSFSHMVRQIEQGDFRPCVYLDQTGVPLDFHLFPMGSLSRVYQELSFHNIHECISFFYSGKESSNRLKQKASGLVKSVNVALDKCLLKKQRLLEDLQQAGRLDSYQLAGELLLANLHQVKRGDTKALVENYYSGEMIEITLDPLLSPSKNAQKLFKRYAKAKTALIEKTSQLLDTDQDIAYLESMLNYLDQAETIHEIEENRLELIEHGYLRKRKNNYQPMKVKSPPHAFQTSEGLRILVGRNNRENDQLTFKTAAGKDIWFHTKDLPGSHVILITDGRPASALSLLEAAQIAAYYSKGRQSANVPVDYTQVRNVKKPSGAKPGMVIFTGNKTIYVNPVLPGKES